MTLGHASYLKGPQNHGITQSLATGSNKGIRVGQGVVFGPPPLSLSIKICVSNWELLAEGPTGCTTKADVGWVARGGYY